MGDWTKEGNKNNQLISYSDQYSTDGPYSVDGDEDTVGFRIDLSGLITLAREVDYEKVRREKNE